MGNDGRLSERHLKISRYAVSCFGIRTAMAPVDLLVEVNVGGPSVHRDARTRMGGDKVEDGEVADKPGANENGKTEGDVRKDISCRKKTGGRRRKTSVGKRARGIGPHPTYPTGCADARRTLRSTPGPAALPLATAARWIAPGSTVFARVLRVGSVRLRMIPPGDPGDLLAAAEAGVICAFSVADARAWRSTRRQSSGPSSSLTVMLPPTLWAVKGGVSEREGGAGSTGGDWVSSMNQSWCAMRNSSTS